MSIKSLKSYLASIKSGLTETAAAAAAGLVLTLTPYTARAEPPVPSPGSSSLVSESDEKGMCLPSDQLEAICKEKYCPPAVKKPCAPVKPRIPRSRCEEHYTGRSDVVGLCLHKDDAQRLSHLEGLVVEHGPDNLCPWGSNYHCEALSTKKVTEYVDSPVPTEDSQQKKALEDALRRIKELEKKPPKVVTQKEQVYIYVPEVKGPEEELFVTSGALARFSGQGARPAYISRAGYQHHFGRFTVGIGGLLVTGEETTSRTVSPGQELLPDGNTKYWNDVFQNTERRTLWGVGGQLGYRAPVFIFSNGLELFSEDQVGLYALWLNESDEIERTSKIATPDGVIFMPPKTISEPRGSNSKAVFGTLLSTGVGLSIPLGNEPADKSAPRVEIQLNGTYLFVPESERAHSLGVEVKGGLRF